MKLYYAAGACSFAPHLLLRETGQTFELESVDLVTHIAAESGDFYAVSPRGMVPVLELDSGERITEQAVIAQYTCDLAGRTDLMPAAGTMARVRVQEWQNFIATEIHKTFSILWKPIDAEMRALVISIIKQKLAHVSAHLAGREYLVGERFTAADAYLFAIAHWSKLFDMDLKAFPDLHAYLKRIADRPIVRETLAAEGPGLIALDD
jgi:glutathione S-transferase